MKKDKLYVHGGDKTVKKDFLCPVFDEKDKSYNPRSLWRTSM